MAVVVHRHMQVGVVDGDVAALSSVPDTKKKFSAPTICGRDSTPQTKGLFDETQISTAPAFVKERGCVYVELRGVLATKTL